jgi:hypothetical protein
MRVLETNWWSISLPDEWIAERDEDAIIIFDEDEVGTIQITDLKREDGDASQEDLLALAEDLVDQNLSYKPASMGDFVGIRFEYEEEDVFVIEWFLRCEDIVLLVSYDCDIDNKAMDVGMVEDILDTLEFVEEAE